LEKDNVQEEELYYMVIILNKDGFFEKGQILLRTTLLNAEEP